MRDQRFLFSYHSFFFVALSSDLAKRCFVLPLLCHLLSSVKNLQRLDYFYALIPRLPRDGVKQLSLDGVIKLTESLIDP